MNISETGENADRKDSMCPFLGLKDDPTTALSYPSSGNHCFHAKPVLPVKLEFQGTHCLTSNHTSCEEFNRSPDTPLLHNLRFERGSRLQVKPRNADVWIPLLVIAVVVLIIWQVFSRGLMGFGNLGHVPVDTVHTISTDVGGGTPAISETQDQVTPTPALPIQTSTPTIVISHALETPIGLKQNLIIHRVLAGESLPSIATLYWTTTEAIQAVNYHLPSPLRVDWLVIIPSNLSDVNGLPAFEAYNVKADVVVEVLAKQLSIDPSLLKLYNGLKDGEILITGEWLLIPHVATATP